MPLPLPRAFFPLHHRVFRTLWLATLASNTGMWVQNTGAGWLMTSLDPSPFMVSMVQAASMLPVFLLALPAGALADIVDRRRFLIGAQLWMLVMATLLALLAATDALGPWGLLAITFGIGAGTAINFPAWAATTPELVPREDLVGAVALNGIGFNLARAVGPALGGFAIAAAGPEAAFALNAVAFLLLIVALIAWRRPLDHRTTLPKEHLVGAMRVGLRFVAASPAMQAAILRACAFFLPAAAVWGLLPLFVRGQLGLGPEAFGLMLGVMGASAVGAGFVLPTLRARMDRGTLVLRASLLVAVAMGLLALAEHWLPAALAMALYGAAWIAAGSTLAVSAQMAAPAWVRARAIAIYQLSFFGMMAFGAALAGWIGARFGVAPALAAAAAGAMAIALVVRPWRLDPAAAREGGGRLRRWCRFLFPRPRRPSWKSSSASVPAGCWKWCDTGSTRRIDRPSWKRCAKCGACGCVPAPSLGGCTRTSRTPSVGPSSGPWATGRSTCGKRNVSRKATWRRSPAPQRCTGRTRRPRLRGT
jgi:MFS family permease